MKLTDISPDIIRKAQFWAGENFDKETRQQVQNLMDNNPAELFESFYTDLEFGTGGLRGIMGVGSNRMNKYTVGMATQGLANYISMNFGTASLNKVAIAYDSRNNSPYFAQIAADILSANNCQVFLFESLRPTPELSYTIRKLGCQSGIVITASHNPKEYNGYKVYWDDGAQLVSPHDKNVISEVRKITSPDMVRFEPVKENIIIIGADIDKDYISEITKLSFIPEVIKKHNDFTIVFTPLHGTGIVSVPPALKAFGFQNIVLVDEQAVADGNFHTVTSPNPEEHSALSMAIDKARVVNADLVLATDPDSDRVGIAVRNLTGEFILLNGNQTASLLIYYLCKQYSHLQKLNGKQFIVKTIVTSELLNEIAKKYNIESFDVLTGFKYIAEIIRNLEGKKQFIGGGEESYGYLIGDFVRDKDAVISCCMIAETAVYAREQGKTLYSLLLEIYKEFGLYYESLLSITKKGKSGADEINSMMNSFRLHPPLEINHTRVVAIKDYKTQEEKNMLNGQTTPINLPVSDVLQFFTEDGSKITIRPSGTEPKIKFYFGIKTELKQVEDFDKTEMECRQKIEKIKEALNL